MFVYYDHNNNRNYYQQYEKVGAIKHLKSAFDYFTKVQQQILSID